MRVGAVVALAVAAGVAAWVLLGGEDDDPQAPAAAVEATQTLPSTTTPAETITQPALQTIPQLRALAAAKGGAAVYWAGARAGTRLEVSQTSSGTVFVRYLPNGTAAGSLDPHLTVATYARPNAFAEVQAAAKNEGTRAVELDGGGLAVYAVSSPTNIHLAYPGTAHQVEVFAPDEGLALRLVSNGKIRPVP